MRTAAAAETGAVTVTSIDGVVLLTGQVLSEEAKSRATNSAAFVGGGDVLRLTNALRVVDAIDTSRLEQDKLLTASVKGLLASNLPPTAPPLETVVENGRVYLLGRVSRQQGDAAADLLGGLRGIEGITTVFLYTD